MTEVSISELRAHLPEYIRLAGRKGPVLVTSRGKEVARLVAPQNRKEEARKKLETLRKTARIGDVMSPVLTDWDALK
jgi:prevent-host-death family protein